MNQVMTAFQQQSGKPSQRRATLLSWERREFWCRNEKRSHRKGRPMSWTVRCAAVIFSTKNHQANPYGNYQRKLEYRLRPCLGKYLLMKSGRLIFENEITDVDMRRHEACAVLLEWFPTTLSRTKFLRSDERVVYLSSPIRNAVLGPNRILITQFTFETTHTHDDVENVTVSHIICRNYQWYFIHWHVLCCARADQLGDHATRCGFSKMVV